VDQTEKFRDVMAAQSRRHGGALVGLAPPKQSYKSPQIEI